RPFDEETAAAPLRDRSSDVEDVTRRLLVAFSGESMRGRHLTEDAVIVAEELMPSTIAELDFTHIKAIATDVGGWTSHTAIIARGLGIPRAVALPDSYPARPPGTAPFIPAPPAGEAPHPAPGTVDQSAVEGRVPAEPRP